MGIQEVRIPLHWNYFLALEDDLIRLSRFVEFTNANFTSYSIDMARIILTSTSEVDVVSKLLCRKIDNNSKAVRINQYRDEINSHFTEIKHFRVRIPRYGLELEPWTNWSDNKTPYWCERMGSSLCLTLDGKREELNVDFVLSPESFEA